MPFPKKTVWPIVALLVLGALALARHLTAPASGSTEGGRSAQGAVKEGSGNGSQGGSRDGAPGGPSGGPSGGTSGGKPPARPLEVAIQVLEPQPLAPKVLSSGTLLAKEEVDLKSEAVGRIVSVRFKEGAKVRKGDLLVKINDAEIKAQLRKIANQLELSQARETRQQTLASRDLISKEELEIAVSEKRSLLADRDMLLAQLAKTEIRAPFDGVVGLKEISEGSNITAGTRIAGLFSLDPLKIDFSIPEQYFGQVQAGDSILIRLEGRTGPVMGTVYAIEPKVDPATRMLRIRGYCPNHEGSIPPGASAKVELPLRVIPDALMVPGNAVLPDIRGQRVMLYKGGKAVAAPVTILYRSEDRLHIAGVSAGDTLIVSGLIQIKPGSPVKAAPDAGGPEKPAQSRGGG